MIMKSIQQQYDEAQTVIKEQEQVLRSLESQMLKRLEELDRHLIVELLAPVVREVLRNKDRIMLRGAKGALQKIAEEQKI